MKVIDKDIKEKNFKEIYLLYGKEEFLKKIYKDRLTKSIVNNKMNFDRYEGKNIDINSFIEKAKSLPFFEERRCILIENSTWFIKNKDINFISHLDLILKNTVLVFVEEEIDKRTKFYKEIEKRAYVLELNGLSEGELLSWLNKLLSLEGKKTSKKNLELILEYVGSDMNELKNEIDKLISYSKESEISEEDIKSIISINPKNYIFNMIDAILNEDNKGAIKLYEALLKLRQEPMFILAMISKQFTQLLDIKRLLLENVDRKTIMSYFSIQEYRFNKIFSKIKNISVEKLKTYVKTCVDLDEMIKNGKLSDTLAIEILIVGK